MEIKADPIVYGEMEGWRNVDLRKDGVDCVPLFGRASIKALTSGAEMHIHPGCIEFCLCIKGNLRYETPEGEFQVLPGRLFVSQPGMPHRRCNNPKGMLLYQILFRIPSKGKTVLGLSARESASLVDALKRFPFRLCPSTPQINAAFERLFTLYDIEKRGSVLRRLKMKSAALELFLALVEAPESVPSARGRPNSKVNAVIERMKTHPEGDYPLDAISAETGLSPVLFIDAFKRATGLTPHAFLLDIRVARARSELADPRRSIEDVAAKYRFSTARHFSTMFKRIVGMRPSDCRRKDT